MPLRSIAQLAKNLFRRSIEKAPTRPINRAPLGSGFDWLEDRTVPTPVITVAKFADAMEGGSAGTFRFTRTETTGNLTVNYTVGGTATEGSDYTALSGSVMFSDGSPTADVSVVTQNDSTTEFDESVVVFLQTGTGYTVGTPGEAIVLIGDNETPLVKVEQNTDAVEGGSNGTFWFTRTGDTSNELTFSWTIGGTATSDDYAPIDTVVTLAAGVTSWVLEVDADDDGMFDPNETVIVTLQSGTGYVVAPQNSATLTIVDTATPFITVEKIDDGAEGLSNGKFRFTRTGDTSSSLTVNYTVGGTATAGTDYTALSGSVTFSPTAPTADVTVTVSNDTTDEPLESVVVSITPNTAYAIGNSGSALVAITDNDLPEVTVTKIVDAAEGGGIGRFRFSRTLGDLSESLVIGYQVGGNATAGTDYASLTGTVTIAANEATADVVITPTPDGTPEGTETVSVNIWGSGYVIGTPSSASMDIREEAAGGVSGKMWKDTDGDGTEDAGETALPYRSVFLMKADEVVTKTITDVNGNYSFSGVTPGTFTVLFHLPGSFTPTTSLDGTEPVTVAPGATSSGIDGGCQPPATPPPATGKRDGIDWSTFNEASPTTPARLPNGVKGNEYPVKTIGGMGAERDIKVFIASPLATQDAPVRQAIAAVNGDIT